MSPKTPGQIAYEAFCVKYPWRDKYQRDPHPKWENLPHWIKANWEHFAR